MGERGYISTFAHLIPNTFPLSGGLDAFITNSSNDIQLYDRSTLNLLGSYSFGGEKVHGHINKQAVNSNQVFVLTESRFVVLEYDTTTYAFTLIKDIPVSLLGSYGIFRMFDSDNYFTLQLQIEYVHLKLTTRLPSATGLRNFNIQLASNSESGVGEYKDFGDFILCSTEDDSGTGDDPCPAVETFDNPSYEIQSNGSVLIRGTPSSANISGYLVSTQSPNETKFALTVMNISRKYR